ncbi:hypothetical protein FB451DRAFT_1533045 [Mycena latifolia]|nr:hypothetical protein FB451DRAFT_1533045 [Mycena latifolia]
MERARNRKRGGNHCVQGSRRQTKFKIIMLKAAFLAVKHLRELSGFGWNEGLKLVAASDDVWEAYLTHPKSKRWRKSPFPLYDDIAYLIDYIVATGTGAFHACGTSQTQTETEGQTQTQSDDKNTPQLPITPLPPVVAGVLYGHKSLSSSRIFAYMLLICW